MEPSLRGPRVVLEPVRAEHAERLRELRAAAEVERWWGPAEEGWPLEVEEELTKLVVKVDGDVVGFVQFWEEPDPEARYADIDIFIGADHQERGLGSEAMTVALAHLMEVRGHHRVTLTTSPHNARAIHVYEKLGFRRVGVLRKSQLNAASGKWEDELLMELVL
jgi:aminoglycoside 6'-N-acetyltransferase